MKSLNRDYWNKKIPECKPNNWPDNTVKVQIEGHDYYGTSLKGEHFEKLKIAVKKIIPLFVVSIAFFPIIPVLYVTGVYRKLGISIREVHYNIKIKFIVNATLNPSKGLELLSSHSLPGAEVTAVVTALQASPLGDINFGPDYLLNLHSLEEDQQDDWKESKNSIMVSVSLSNLQGPSLLPTTFYLPLCYFKNENDFIQFSYRDTKYKLQISSKNIREFVEKCTTTATQRDPLFGVWRGPLEFYNKENIRKRYKVEENEGDLILVERSIDEELIPGKAACGLQDDKNFLKVDSTCYETSGKATSNNTYFYVTNMVPKSIDIIFYDDRVVFYGHVSSDIMPLAEQGLCRAEDMCVFWHEKKLKNETVGAELSPEISSQIKSMMDQDVSKLIELSLRGGILIIKWIK